jgi:hypothetical protein
MLHARVRRRARSSRCSRVVRDNFLFFTRVARDIDLAGGAFDCDYLDRWTF